MLHILPLSHSQCHLLLLQGGWRGDVGERRSNAARKLQRDQAAAQLAAAKGLQVSCRTSAGMLRLSTLSHGYIAHILMPDGVMVVCCWQGDAASRLQEAQQALEAAQARAAVAAAAAEAQSQAHEVSSAFRLALAINAEGNFRLNTLYQLLPGLHEHCRR